VKAAEAKVTVSDEGAHPELACERQRLAVGRAGLVPLIDAPLARDVAEQLEGPRFPSSLLVCARQVERALGGLDRIPGAAGPQIRLAQKSDQQGAPHHDVQ